MKKMKFQKKYFLIGRKGIIIVYLTQLLLSIKNAIIEKLIRFLQIQVLLRFYHAQKMKHQLFIQYLIKKK